MPKKRFCYDRSAYITKRIGTNNILTTLAGQRQRLKAIEELYYRIYKILKDIIFILQRFLKSFLVLIDIN